MQSENFTDHRLALALTFPNQISEKMMLTFLKMLSLLIQPNMKG